MFKLQYIQMLEYEEASKNHWKRMTRAVKGRMQFLSSRSPSGLGGGGGAPSGGRHCVHPKEQKQTLCTVFTEALFTVAERRKQPQCPPTGDSKQTAVSAQRALVSLGREESSDACCSAGELGKEAECSSQLLRARST